MLPDISFFIFRHLMMMFSPDDIFLFTIFIIDISFSSSFIFRFSLFSIFSFHFILRHFFFAFLFR